MPFTIYPQLFSEATSFSEEQAGMKLSEMDDVARDKAEITRWSYMAIGGVMERLGIEKATRNILKGGTKKRVLNVLESAVVEGTTEETQSRTLRSMVKYIEDRDIEVFESDDIIGIISEFFTSDDFIVGSILGGGMRGTLESYDAVYEKFLAPDTGATSVDWNAVKDVPDEVIAMEVLKETGKQEMADLAVKAKNGDKDAQKEYVEKHYYTDEELGDVEGELSPEDKAKIAREREQDDESLQRLKTEREEILSRIKIKQITVREFSETSKDREDLSALKAEMERVDSAIANLTDKEAQKQQRFEEDQRIITEAINTAQESIESEDVEIDVDLDRLDSLKTRIDEVAEQRGMDQTQKDAYTLKVLEAAASNMGTTVDKLAAKMDTLRVSGESTREFVDDVISYRIKINQGGDLDTLYEEAGHTEFKRLQDKYGREEALSKVKAWKAQVEAETGTETPRRTWTSGWRVKAWLGHSRTTKTKRRWERSRRRSVTLSNGSSRSSKRSCVTPTCSVASRKQASSILR